MPRSRDLSAYPIEHYWQLCKRVIDTQESFVVPCERTQALALRGELYAFRRACQANETQSRIRGIDVQAMNGISFRPHEQGLECLPTAQLAGPKLIEAALGKAITPQGADPAAESLKRFMNLQGEKGNG